MISSNETAFVMPKCLEELVAKGHLGRKTDKASTSGRAIRNCRAEDKAQTDVATKISIMMATLYMIGTACKFCIEVPPKSYIFLIEHSLTRTL